MSKSYWRYDASLQWPLYWRRRKVIKNPKNNNNNKNKKRRNNATAHSNKSQVAITSRKPQNAFSGSTHTHAYIRLHADTHIHSEPHLYTRIVYNYCWRVLAWVWVAVALVDCQSSLRIQFAWIIKGKCHIVVIGWLLAAVVVWLSAHWCIRHRFQCCRWCCCRIGYVESLAWHQRNAWVA